MPFTVTPAVPCRVPLFWFATPSGQSLRPHSPRYLEKCINRGPFLPSVSLSTPNSTLQPLLTNLHPHEPSTQPLPCALRQPPPLPLPSPRRQPPPPQPTHLGEVHSAQHSVATAVGATPTPLLAHSGLKWLVCSHVLVVVRDAPPLLHHPFSHYCLQQSTMITWNHYALLLSISFNLVAYLYHHIPSGPQTTSHRSRKESARLMESRRLHMERAHDTLYFTLVTTLGHSS